MSDKISKLKRKAKKLHTKYYDKLSTFSCGAELAETISPELAKLRVDYLDVLAQLKRIDSSFPK